MHLASQLALQVLQAPAGLQALSQNYAAGHMEPTQRDHLQNHKQERQYREDWRDSGAPLGLWEFFWERGQASAIVHIPLHTQRVGASPRSSNLPARSLQCFPGHMVGAHFA